MHGFNVVWFSNPGHAINDAQTVQTLMSFVFDQRNGLVLQGDDMTRASDLPSMDMLEPLNRLENRANNNGTEVCGVYIDNNLGGDYTVKVNGASHPVIAGLEGKTFLYGDDIDTSHAITDPKAEVLAWATVASSYCIIDPPSDPEPCKETVPVIVAYDPWAP